MRALTVNPGQPHSLNLDEVPPPPESDGAVLVRAIALGICGTDREIIEGLYGSAPKGAERLIIGHELLGQVEEAPAECGVTRGDLVVGIVRRPDPVPCPACAAGEWDMCRNGQYTERGIKQRNGYGSEQFRVEPDFLIKLDPALGFIGVLLEPASVVAKAWEQTLRIGARSASWQPRTALVTGAGPVGLLAALMGAQRGLEMHVFDRAQDGRKARRSCTRSAPPTTRVRWGTFAPTLSSNAPERLRLWSTSSAEPQRAALSALPASHQAATKFNFDIGDLNRTMVLENDMVFGSVNANRRHYRDAAEALAGPTTMAHGANQPPRAAGAMARGIRAARQRHQGRCRFHRVAERPWHPASKTMR